MRAQIRRPKHQDRVTFQPMVERLKALLDAGEHVPVKGQIASIPDLTGHVISTVVTQYCLETQKSQINMQMNRYGCIPVKLCNNLLYEMYGEP